MAVHACSARNNFSKDHRKKFGNAASTFRNLRLHPETSIFFQLYPETLRFYRNVVRPSIQTLTPLLTFVK